MPSKKETAPAHPENLPEEQDILRSKTTCYQILDFNGEGTFGKVAICLDLKTSKTVAIKIHKDAEDDLIEKEVAMLKAVSVLDPNKKNIVRFLDDFRYHDHSCLAFEMLDMSLWDLLKKRQWKPLSLNEIRPVAHQLLVAFEALKSIGIMHTDLKPDNVMLVNHKDQPFKIKLIDFGLAIHTSEVEVGMMMQNESYRAPEVNLGLPLSESVDMWAVGCVMAFLYFGANLFPCNCPYHWMKTVVRLVGQPGNHHILSGLHSWAYFIWDEVYRSCLDPDHDLRITPREAVKHGFITMDHLKTAASSYSDTAIQLMAVSPLETSEGSDNDNTNEDNSNAALITDHGKDSAPSSGYDADAQDFAAESKDLKIKTSILFHLSIALLMFWILPIHFIHLSHVICS
uniref:Protein kinase domain-containing protein n=1 Tax=Echeneis naucrates TaxID=173247 RepID=A0A665UE92_ECHNA